MDKKILNFREGCELLGLSPSYVYKLTSAKLIPFSKPMGKVIYFSRAELEQWMAGKWQPERAKVAATHVTLNPVG